jgi:hypothetical protein
MNLKVSVIPKVVFAFTTRTDSELNGPEFKSFSFANQFSMVKNYPGQQVIWFLYSEKTPFAS